MNLGKYFKYGAFKAKNVLLVDDEEDLGWILRKIIQEAGHRFIYASTLKEGMEKFKKSTNLDIAIIDLRLENENGLVFIKKAKMMKINTKVKFIMISAFGTPGLKDKARQLGVRHFLDKPLKAEKLLHIINHGGI